MAAGDAIMNAEMPIAELVAEMGQRIAAIISDEAEEGVVPRFNQAKTLGCLRGEFRVHQDVPAELRHGIFAEAKTYPAMLRFANATSRDDAEKDARGLSIRLSGARGPVLWGEEGFQDFVLNSYPALFVATPEDFLGFIRARQADRKLWFFLNPFNPHLKSFWIAFKSRQKHLCPFDVRFWSTTPYKLGEDSGQVVKYSVIPCSDYQTTQAENPGRDQLRAAMRAHLRREPAKFHFAVQLQTEPASMPIEDASVIWDETLSPFQIVATITIEDQDFADEDTMAACERRSFNPWQSLAAHEPLGRMNLVRREVYAHAAALRTSNNRE
ncbi:catalase [Methylomonas sp. SURF-2]|uniref:Catalase n=1 Tax=Methylomonas subterranea TaxID=2952225 RepID=A0ABT1TCY0_9GAMM|nr:catalase [Methylomonas sp. SURF-2]MCQ8103149.1 catalase [Methylomonas sp. SURF-2]